MVKREKILGLDIGHHSVKAVVAEKRGRNYTVLGTELLPFIGSPEEQINMLKGWLQKHDLQGLPCVLGISGRSVRFQPLILPLADQRPLGAAVATEVGNFNELAQEASIYSFVALPHGPDGARRLLLSIVRPTVLEELMAMPRLCGLNVVDIIPLGVAMANAMGGRASVNRPPCLCIDIGDTATEVAVASSTGLLFARSFAVGGRMFTEAIARVSGDITLAQAESSKITKGDMRGDDPASQALRQTAGTWLTELQSCLAIYRSAFQATNEQPNLIILSGGGSELRHLPEFIGEAIGIETTRAGELAGGLPKEHSARFANANGLAMAGLGLGAVGISLLPREIRDELELRRKKPYWIAAGFTAACILAVFVAGGYRDSLRIQKQLEKKRQVLTVCTEQAGKVQNIKSFNSQILAMLQPPGDLLWNGWLMEETIALAARARQSNDWITMIADGDSYFSPLTPSAGPPGSRDRPPKTPLPPSTNLVSACTRMIIEGYTSSNDFSTVKPFIEELRKAPFVESADLMPDDQLMVDREDAGRGGFRGKRFVIDLRVKPPTRGPT